MISAQDFVGGADMTGKASVDAADLNNLINNGTPSADKGIVILSTDVAGNPVVPDARATADGGLAADSGVKWQRYLWIRIQATVASVYVWNPNAPVDAVLLKWVPTGALLPAGSITGDKIAPATIDALKIISVDWGQLTNIPASGFIPGGNAGGALSGTYPNPTLRDNSITSSKLAAESVQSAALGGSNGGAPCIDIAKNIVTTGVWTAKQLIRVNDAATGLQGETKKIIQLAEPAVGNTLRQVQVNSAGNGFQYSAHSFLQKVYQIDTTADSDNASTRLTTANTLPTTAFGKDIPGLSIAFTPLSVGSTIRVSLRLNVLATTTVWAALFITGNANAVAASCGAINTLGQLSFEYEFVPGSLAAIDFTVSYGRIAADINLYNQGNGTLFNLGGLRNSSITIEERL